MSIVDNNDHEVIDGPILFHVTEVMKNAGIEEFYLEGNDFVMKFKEGGMRCFPFNSKSHSVSEIMKKINQKLKKEPIYESLEAALSDIESQLIERREEIFQNHDQNRTVRIQTYNEVAIEILERITTTRELVIENNLNYSAWLTELDKKYLRLKDLALSLLPELWLPLEFVISAKMILKIKGWTLPFMAVLLAVPSSMKTVALDMLIDYPDTYTTDEFTPSSFVSHNSGKSEEELQKIDMLPRMVNKVCIFPELAPLFTSKDEDLQRNFGKILRILDGKGFQSDSGAQGHRGYSSDMMFVILGAAVEVPYRVYKLFGNLGQKIYYLRLPRVDKTKEERKEAAKQKNDFREKVYKIKGALFDYLIWLDSAPESVAQLDKNGLLKFEWDIKKENEREQDTALGYIVDTGELLAHLRGVVNTYESPANRKYNKKNAEVSQNGNDTTSPGLESLPTYSDFEYDFSIIEESSRAITHLKSLAMGHAITMGRNYITLKDIPIVIKVALSSASIGRVRVFDLLLEHKGELTTSDICKELKVSPQTAHRTMTELHALEIVDMSAIGTYSNAELKIKLKEEFRWFLTPEFEKLRERFKPADYTKLKYKINVTESNIENNAQNSESKIDHDNDDAYFRHTNEENLPPNRAKNNFNKDVKGEKPNRNERLQSLDDKIITDNKLNELQSTTISSEACHITTNGREQQALSDKSIDNDENNFNVPKGGEENCKPVTARRLHERTTGSVDAYEHQLAVNQILTVIKEESLTSFNDATKVACSRNELLKSYIGDKLTSRENRKVRNIAVEIIRHTNVEVIKHKPQLLLKWVESSKSEFQSGATT